jgi:hypothetical protein
VDLLLPAIFGLGGTILGAAIAWLAARDAANIQARAAMQVARDAAERAGRELEVRWMREHLQQRLGGYLALRAAGRDQDWTEFNKLWQSFQSVGHWPDIGVTLADDDALHATVGEFLEAESQMWASVLEAYRNPPGGQGGPAALEAVNGKLESLRPKALAALAAVNRYVVAGPQRNLAIGSQRRRDAR